MNFQGPVRFHKRRGAPCPCEWCGETIETGWDYVTWGERYDGEFTNIRMHDVCYWGGFREIDWEAYDHTYQLRDMQRGHPASKDCPVPHTRS